MSSDFKIPNLLDEKKVESSQLRLQLLDLGGVGWIGVLEIVQKIDWKLLGQGCRLR